MYKKNINKFILIYLSFGVFILAQSHSYSLISGYGIFNILDVRGFMGASTFQTLLLLSTTLLLLFNFRIKQTNYKRKLFLKLVFLLSIASISMLLLTNNKTAGFRTIIDYFSPLIYFYLFSQFLWSKKNIKLFVKLLTFFYAINLIVGFFQWIFLGYTIDNMQGLVDNAHQFSLLMYISTLYLLSKYWLLKKNKYLFLAIPPIVISLVASNDKATIFFVITLTIVYLIFKRISAKRIMIAIFTSLIVIISSIYLLNELEDRYKDDLVGGLRRFDNSILKSTSLIKVVSNSPQFIAYSSIPSIYLNNLYSLFIGVGPTMFGSEEVDMSSKFSSIAFPTGIRYVFGSTALTYGTSFYLVLLIEFGLLASIIYALVMLSIFILVFKFRTIEGSIYIRHLLIWLLGYLIFITLLSFVSRGEGLAGSTNTIPYFVLLGILNSYLTKNKTYSSNDLLNTEAFSND